MIIPLGAPTFREAVRYGAEVPRAEEDHRRPGACHRRRRRRRLRAHRRQPRGGDPAHPRGHRQGRLHGRHQIAIGLDCAASEFYKDGKLHRKAKAATLTAAERTDILATWATSTRSSASRTAWPRATGTAGSTAERLGSKVQLVGDDLFVTNTKILKRASRRRVANSILIKINQIGTLTETFAAIEMAKRAGWTAVISHRPARPRTRRSPTSPWAPTPARSRPARSRRSDRIAKYNQLLRIEAARRHPWATMSRSLSSPSAAVA